MGKAKELNKLKGTLLFCYSGSVELFVEAEADGVDGVFLFDPKQDFFGVAAFLVFQDFIVCFVG